MSGHKMSFLAYLIAFGAEYMDISLPEAKGRQKAKQNIKKENKLITHHIRTQNRNRMLRSAYNRTRYP